MLYSVTASNFDGIDGTALLSNGKVIPTNHPLNDQPGFNPEELLALAWATCLNATIKALLEAKQVATDSQVDVTVQLHKESDKAGYYFSVEGQAKIKALSLEEARSLVQEAHLRCPISKIIQASSTVSLETLVWT